MTQRMNMLHNIVAISFFMVTTIALVPGCSTEPKRVAISATANVNDEITLLTQDLQVAKQNQINVLAPRNFDKSQEHLKKAREAREKNKDNKDILASVGLSKAYLNLANQHAERVRPSAKEVLMAREEAITAGAPQLLPKHFAKADNNLMEVTSDAEKSRSSLKADKRPDLQRNYFDLQMEALKASQLKAAENSIETAKKMGARRYAPRTLDSAEAKFEAASNIIETDRNNSAAIEQAAVDAKLEATKLLNVTSIAKKNRTSESVALELNARRMASEQLAGKVSQTDARLVEEQKQLDQIRKENAELAKRNEFNESFAWAQKQFSPGEAEVFRQGDNLLIRLRGMNYKSGQSELSSKAYPVLGKVKDVIAKMGAEKVTVEGHTDATGNKVLNQNLSQARAENVAEFIADDQLITKDQVDAEGYGFERPLAPNTTAQGRAQNRRVDIIVSPGEFNATTSEE